MKLKKKQNKRIGINLLTITVLAVALIALTAIIYFLNLNLTRAPLQSNAPDLPTQQIVGKVTRVYVDGRLLFRDDDGSIKASSHDGLADIPNSIKVGDEEFNTSSGAAPPEHSYNIDIRSFAPGDDVTVTYATSSSGEKTLNCKRCSIEKN